ncbi:restriction endonuclease subunit S [Alkalibacterium sp. s-m-22]
MSKEKLIPKLRFDEFVNEENWIKYELGNNAIIKGRLGWKNLKQEEYVDRGPAMIAGRHINNGIINWNKVDHIPLWRYKESPDIMLKENDIIFSKDGSLGNPAIIKQLPSLATINATMMLVRVSDKINSEFFYQILNGSQFNELINIKVSGSSIPHLFQADMEKFSFYSPEILEQEKIGKFFKKLDQMIQLQQSKVNKVKDIKSAYLSEMFPKEGEKYPKKRFEGFKESWKEYSLGEVGNLYQPQTISRTSLQSSGIPVFGANGYIGYYSNANHEEDQITISARGENAGNPSYVVGPVWITGNSMVVNVDENTNINKKFLYSYLSSQRLEKYITGGAQPQLTRDVLNKVPIQIPSFLEQEKIGQFFKNLDNQISIEEEKLSKLEKLKQAYLNDMFV